MARKRTPVAVIAALALALPAAALAGTVTFAPTAITYDADPGSGAPESIGLQVDSGRAVMRSDRGFSSVPAECNQDVDVIDCDPAAGWVVRLLGFEDSVSTDGVVGAMTIEAHGGAGGDNLSGAVNADRLFGDDGGDSIDAKEGNDLLDGGAGDDSLSDGPGDDAVIAGPGDDLIHPGTGRDDVSGGLGNDTVYYQDRTAGVTITLDDRADDGEAGEGDNARADVEDAVGGSGPDRIVGTDAGNRLTGGDGDDSIAALGAEDSVDAGPGNDSIDSRDGGYDTVDCGTGFDTVVADQGDSLTGCESVSVPDADGDGFVAGDCDNADPARHPGAFEIIGDGIDQDCDGIDAPRPRLVHPVGFDYSTLKRRHAVRINFLTLREVAKGDRVAVRCKGRGCAFAKKVRIGRAGRSLMKLTPLFKKRPLRPRVVIEIRITRPQWVGKYVRIRVTRKLKMVLTTACLPPGSPKPGACT